MKFGLLSYNYTTNLGNEIQSIAARRFLPQIDHYIEHEKLERFKDSENVKVIMNAWYLDCPTAWPPSENIDPLLVSMHFTTRQKLRKEAILTEKSREFFERHGPVGCRDHHTVDFLSENDIDAYYTGCLTLTLDSGKKGFKSDEEYIVVNVANPDELVSYLKGKTDRKIYFIYQDMIPSYEKAFPETTTGGIYTLTSLYDCREKFFMAENLLRIYENASCVITDRIHCALPCLAFEVPVLFLESDRMPERLNGIRELFNRTTLDEYFRNFSIFDVENPHENPKDYLKIRKDLIDKCREFTGCVNDSCYTDITSQDLLDRNSLILSKNAYESRAYMREILKRYKNEMNLHDESRHAIEMQNEKIRKLNDELNNKNRAISDLNSEIADANSRIDDLKSEIDALNGKIDEITSTSTWKLHSKFRK